MASQLKSPRYRADPPSAGHPAAEPNARRPPGDGGDTVSKPTSTADQPRSLRAFGRRPDSRLLLVNRPTLHLNWGHRLLLPALSGEQVPGTGEGVQPSHGDPTVHAPASGPHAPVLFSALSPTYRGVFSAPPSSSAPPYGTPRCGDVAEGSPTWHFYTFSSMKASKMARLLGSEMAALSHGKGHGTHSTRPEPRSQDLSCHWHVDAGFPSARATAKPPVPDLRTHGSPDLPTHEGHRETGVWCSAIGPPSGPSRSSDSRQGRLPEARAEVSEARHKLCKVQAGPRNPPS